MGECRGYLITPALCCAQWREFGCRVPNLASDSRTARQLVKNSDARLTLSPVKNIGDVVFYLLWSEGRPSSKGMEGRISKFKFNSHLLFVLMQIV